MTYSLDYNGWTNRSTWLVLLHLDNDYGFNKQLEEGIIEFAKCINLYHPTAWAYGLGMLTIGITKAILTEIIKYHNDPFSVPIVSDFAMTMHSYPPDVDRDVVLMRAESEIMWLNTSKHVTDEQIAAYVNRLVNIDIINVVEIGDALLERLQDFLDEGI
jgi:hypothetical protein